VPLGQWEFSSSGASFEWELGKQRRPVKTYLKWRCFVIVPVPRRVGGLGVRWASRELASLCSLAGTAVNPVQRPVKMLEAALLRDVPVHNVSCAGLGVPLEPPEGF
jgi:hypothetical protein